MSVNEKVDVETGDYGSIVAGPKNDIVAYGKRRTIALGALCVLTFGAAVALTLLASKTTTMTNLAGNHDPCTSPIPSAGGDCDPLMCDCRNSPHPNSA